MNKNKIIRMIAACSAVVAALGITVAAAYDSSEDPLISLSYLNDVFKNEFEEEIDEKLTSLENRLTDAINNSSSETQTPPDTTTAPVTNPGTSSTYEVIELTSGDAIYAVSACDIMLRAGTATCIAPDASQGIADYTDAVEIYNGQAFTKNHMCLIPRGDGRGLLATSESVYIMVRGEYTIVKK